MLFDFESLHLSQLIHKKVINFPRDEGENKQNMLIFMLGAVKSINFPRDEGENKQNMLIFVLDAVTP